MIYFLRKIFIVCLLPGWLPVAVHAAEFQEGTHYQRLSSPVPTAADDKVEVVEVFWYGCPHCYRLEPEIETWLENKPDNVAFIRLPHTLGRRIGELHARAYYVAEILGVLDRIHKPLFDAIHAEGRAINTPEQLAEFFIEHGVDREAFDKTFDSFELHAKFNRGQQLMKQYRITGVPAMVVDGKYVTNATLAGSEEKIFEVIDYLVGKESEQG